MTLTDTAVCPLTSKYRLTKATAKRQAAWWRRRRFARMNAYRCACGSWHIGNDNRKPEEEVDDHK